MSDEDFDQFAAMLDDVAALLTPQSPLSSSGRAMYFRALSKVSLEQVRAGLDAHVRDPQRGRWFPKPADVLAQIADDRPGADEAWTIAIRGRDEAVSIVWTSEIAEAWCIAKPVLQLGDEVGARMAFRDAYTRLVGEAKKAGAVAKWFASLGHDPEGREVALREEARLAGSLFAAIEPPRRGGNPLLPLLQSEGMPFDVRQRLLKVREQIIGKDARPVEPDPDGQAKVATAARAAEIMKRSRAYAAEHDIDLTRRPLPARDPESPAGHDKAE